MRVDGAMVFRKEKHIPTFLQVPFRVEGFSLLYVLFLGDFQRKKETPMCLNSFSFLKVVLAGGVV